jgi:hypothetical protein
MVKAIHDSLYAIHFGLTLLTLISISIFILLAWSNQCKVIFQIFVHASKPIQRPTYIQYEMCHLSFDLCMTFPHLCILDSSSTLIKAYSLSNYFYSHKASHTWDQSKIIHSCLFCHLPNMLTFLWYYDIPQYRSHFINFICIVVFFLN